MGRTVSIIGTWAALGFASWTNSVAMALLDSDVMFPLCHAFEN